MKVLYITSKPSYPCKDGGSVASASFLNCLLEVCKVKLFTISTQKHPFDTSNFPKEIVSNTNLETIKIDTNINAFEAFKYLFNSKSYNLSRFDSKLIHARLNKILKESYDCVILDSLYSALYIDTIRSNTKAKVIIRTHNVEHEIWEHYSSNNSNPIKKWYLAKLASDLRKQEIQLLNQFDGVISISEEDTNKFKLIGIKTPIENLSIAVNINESKHNYDLTSLFHLGSMNWAPNIEAVDSIIELLPSIRDDSPELNFHIAGSHMNGKYANLESRGIIEDGFIENISNYVTERGILVSPIKSGSGIRVKILEMMSLGIPIITTSLGSQGIHAEGNLIIANTDNEIKKSIIQLRNDKNLREKLGINSIDYIRTHHNKKTLSKQLLEFIRKS